MKTGGNAAATDFFNKHGGGVLLSEGNAKKKYDSKVAELYRAELDKREKADEAMFPAGVFVEGATGAAPVTAPPESADDDFFDTWDKPAAAPAKGTNGSAAAPAKPPVIGRASSTPSSTGPRTVTSASLRAGTGTSASAKPARLGLGASRLNSASSTPVSGGSKKLGGLRGAAKAAAPIDFDKAQRDAEAEEERIKQLGYDRKREEEAAAAAAAAVNAATAAKAASKELGGPAKTGLAPTPPTAPGSTRLVSHQKGNSQDMARLGMGMKRLGMGTASPSASSAASPSANASSSSLAEESTQARSNFGAQKAISSDMYFGRGIHDPSRSAENQARLQQFNGASAISSASYFGRDEDEEAAARGMGSGDSGMLGDGSLEGVSLAARDAISRVMANPDVQNGVESLRQGALKVCSMFIKGLIAELTCNFMFLVQRIPCTDGRTLSLDGMRDPIGILRI